MKATAKMYLYDKRLKRNGKYPVKIRVIFQRKTVFFPTGVDLTKEEFLKVHLNKSLRKQFEEIVYFLKKTEEIIEKLGTDFSWSEFEISYFNRQSVDKSLPNTESLNIIEQIKKYEGILIEEGRLSSAESYGTTANHLQNFAGKKNKSLLFSSVTPEFLLALEKYLLNTSKIRSYASVGIYMRNIRCVFNRALSKKLINPEIYPFGKNKYTPPATRKAKRALSIGDIENIYNYKSKEPGSPIDWAKDMWLFAYFSNGMNIKDIAYLKYENIQKDKMSFKFIREKTKSSTKDNLQTIEVAITEDTQQIMNKWGNKPINPSTYIFNIFDPNRMSEKEKRDAVKSASKRIGKYMKKIAVELNLEKTPTYIYARHSFSTILKRAGVPIEMISEQLGHTSIKTTETYLGTFESDKKREVIKFLTSFKNKI
jgi:integrase/recombinase XerD